MRTQTLLAIASLACSGTLFAQVQYTLPTGLARTENSQTATYPFDAAPSFRYQEVHHPFAGARPAAITSMMFRRGIKDANAGATARAADITLRMGHGDLPSFFRTFDANYGTTPTTVLPNTRVELPDWSAAKNPSERLTFDLALPFQTPFAHNGTDDIVWEIFVQNQSVDVGSGYVTERVPGVLPYSARDGALALTGCTANGQAGPMSHRVRLYNYGPSHGLHPMRAEFYAGNNPPYAPVTMAFGYQELSMPIGFCERLYVLPRTYVPLGVAGFHGTDLRVSIDLPYAPEALGVTLRTQCYAPDASHPAGVVLSNGSAATMPGFLDRGPRFRYIFANHVGAATGQGPHASGAVLTGYR